MLNRRTTTHRSFLLEIPRRDLIGMIKDHVSKHTSGPLPPKDARVYVMVPGGGDWSGQPLDLDDAPVLVEWETTEYPEGDG